MLSNDAIKPVGYFVYQLWMLFKGYRDLCLGRAKRRSYADHGMAVINQKNIKTDRCSRKHELRPRELVNPMLNVDRAAARQGCQKGVKGCVLIDHYDWIKPQRTAFAFAFLDFSSETIGEGIWNFVLSSQRMDEEADASLSP